MQEGASSRTLYLPPESRWYDVSHLLTNGTWSESQAGELTVAAPLDTLPLHLRGGQVTPLQQPAVNTKISRNNPFEFLGLSFILLNNLNHYKVSLFSVPG